MEKKIKFGVFGLGRGAAYLKVALMNGAEVVAVCDRDEEKLKIAQKIVSDDLAVYTDFDELLNHPELDAIFLCNNFDQHAPFAIKALERNIHVLSECTSNGTMASVAILAHRSILEGGTPHDIPDFRREEDRKKYENDTLSPFYGIDGSEPTLPCALHS